MKKPKLALRLFLVFIAFGVCSRVSADETPRYTLEPQLHRGFAELSFYFPAAWYQGEYRAEMDQARAQSLSQRSRLGSEFSGYFPTTLPKCEWNLGLRVSGDHLVQDGGTVFHWMIPFGFRYIASGSFPEGFLFRVAVGPTLSHGNFVKDQSGPVRLGGGVLLGVSYQVLKELSLDANHTLGFSSGGLTELLGLGITLRVREFDVASLFLWPLELIPHTRDQGTRSY